VYQEDVLHGDVKHLNMALISSQEWVFQQDSVPAQTVKTTQGVAAEEPPGLQQHRELAFGA